VTTIFGGHDVLSPQGSGFKALTHYVQDFTMKLSLVLFKEEYARKLVFFVGPKIMGLKVDLLVSKHFKDLLGFNEISGMYGRELPSLPLMKEPTNGVMHKVCSQVTTRVMEMDLAKV